MKRRRNFKSMLPSERSKSEKAAYCLISTICHSKTGKTTETIKDQQLPGVKYERRMNRQSAEDFRGRKTILNDTIMVDACHTLFLCQDHRMYNTKSKSECKL